MWIHVIPHFEQFLKEIELTLQQRIDADTKAENVARCLWNKYYGGDFSSQCYVRVGSYGKRTATRPPSDLDMLFLLPVATYSRVDRIIGNKQSQLLQEVKLTLQGTFPNTELRADGQVVLAPFQTYNVEVVPAFQRKDGTYITAHTSDGGSWRLSNPVAEFQAIADADGVSAAKATHLIKMLKIWKRECSVDIKSLSLEVLACAFVTQWLFRDRTIYYYDWLVRDFFEFMLRYRYGWTRVPGTQEIIQLGDTWGSKCESAYKRAVKACEYERADLEISAADEWQKIFGSQFRSIYRASAAVSA